MPVVADEVDGPDDSANWSCPKMSLIIWTELEDDGVGGCWTETGILRVAGGEDISSRSMVSRRWSAVRPPVDVLGVAAVGFRKKSRSNWANGLITED